MLKLKDDKCSMKRNDFVVYFNSYVSTLILDYINENKDSSEYVLF